MDGIINVYKEPGFTSHDVVAKLRGILHMKKSVIQVRLIRMHREFCLCVLGKQQNYAA